MFRPNTFGFLAVLLCACQNAPGSQPSAAEVPAAASGNGAQAGSPALAVGTATPAAGTQPSTSSVNTAVAPASSTNTAVAPASAASPASPDAPAASANAAAANAPPAAAPPSSPATAAPAAPAADSCMRPERYARANRVAIDLSWPETLVWTEGSGQFVSWLKNTYTKQPDGSTLVESRLCGTVMPVMTSSDFVGGLKSSAQMPFSSFDNPSLPVLRSTLSAQASTRNLTMVLGASLSDPEGAWPKDSELVPSDDDRDGAPGMTVVPERGPEFLEPPTSVSQLEFIDRLYIAARARVQVTAAPTCSATSEAQLEPLAFDSTPVGCHVRDRDACTAEELRFVMSQNPRFKLGQSGRWVETDVPLEASCETVRATLP